MKIRKLLALLLALALSFAAFTACDDEPPTSADKVTVTFDSNGGGAVASKEINKGERIGELPVPTGRTDEHIFYGWYTSAYGLATELTPETVINGDVTLYARWYIESVNLFEDDLSSLIDLPAEKYKGVTIPLRLDEVTDADIERVIMNLRYKNRNTTPLYDGAGRTDIAITVGDTAYIKYRGYIVDENGIERDLDNASNIISSSFSALGVGSLNLIQGFEEGLIGAIPSEHTLELISNGRIREGDVVYVSYTVRDGNGKTTSKSNERIDLSKSYVDSLYGTGFKSALVGAELGSVINSLIIECGDQTLEYSNIKLNYLTRTEGNALKVSVKFPEDYKDEAVRGLRATFDVFVEKTIIYDVPEYTESFVRERLGITDAHLVGCEGDTILEKHRDYLYKQATNECNAINSKLKSDAYWNYLIDTVKVRALPKKIVEDRYNEICYEIQTQYSRYSAYYPTFELFAKAYLGIGDDILWSDYVRAVAEAAAVERMIFYHIVNSENLVTRDQAFEEKYNAIVEEHVDYYVSYIYAAELEKITDEAEKQAKIKEIEQKVIESYGEEYFLERVYYEIASPKLVTLVNFADVD